jgi:hypothetical protein
MCRAVRSERIRQMLDGCCSASRIRRSSTLDGGWRGSVNSRPRGCRAHPLLSMFGMTWVLTVICDRWRPPNKMEIVRVCSCWLSTAVLFWGFAVTYIIVDNVLYLSYHSLVSLTYPENHSASCQLSDVRRYVIIEICWIYFPRKYSNTGIDGPVGNSNKLRGI